jgi:RHS repeat-associated protein
MTNKKSIFQLFFSIALFVCISNTSFGQVYMYCSVGNYSFKHLHDYPYIDLDGDGFGGTMKSGALQCTLSVPKGYAFNNRDCNDNNAAVTPYTIWYRDADGDTYGDGANTTTSCTQPVGYISRSGDYDDTTVNITYISPSYFYYDSDGDGFGNPNSSVYYSVKPARYVSDNTDCNDNNGAINPNTKWYQDYDGDGYGSKTSFVVQCNQPSGYILTSGDCNDYFAEITTVENTDIYGQKYMYCSATNNSFMHWHKYPYIDNDYDGYGSNVKSTNLQCTVVVPRGYAFNNTDCNDGDTSLNPTTVWYRDSDGDSYGTSATTTISCTQPSGYVRNSDDYNDGTPNITYIAPSYFYYDNDNDGFGNPTISVYYSVAPSRYVTSNTDCNDSDGSLNPNTIWYADVDADGYGSKILFKTQCSQPTGYIRTTGDFDDTTVNITNIQPQTFYYDGDGDGFGNPNSTVYYSNKPVNYVTNNLDCNDTEASVNPNTRWYRDVDSDGFGSESSGVIVQCNYPSNGGYSIYNTDCNDNDRTINPRNVWYRDFDKDGYGDPNNKTNSCAQPVGFVSNGSDYDDSTTNITNVAPQTFYRDVDGDGYGDASINTATVYYSVKPSGYANTNTDCNDGDASLNPNTFWYADADGDGYGSKTVSIQQCAQPTGFIRLTGDYDDTTVNITNIAPQTFYADNDKDNFGNPSVTKYYSIQPTGYLTNNLDCNDGDASLNPNTIWYADADTDGYGSKIVYKTQCTQPTGYIRTTGDFDDTTANITDTQPQTFYRDADGDTFGSKTVSVYYSAKPTGYVTNNSDYDDGTVNITNIAPQTFYRDADGDGFGDSNTYTPTLYYSLKPAGYVTNKTDCDDTKNTINPNTKWYADTDGDGLGDAASFVTQCTPPAGNYVLDNTDNCPLVSGTSSDCGGLANPSSDKNYIITKAYKVASTSSIASLTPAQATVGITYYDGLGRPIQQIANQQSNTGKDIVTHLEYDTFGRQTKDYLPFVGTNRNMAFDSSAKNNTLSFYNIPNYENTANPFSENALESSPLSRVLKQAAPGNDWAIGQGHEIKLDYQTNVANEVKRFTATTTWNATTGVYDTALDNASGTTFYDANQLYKNLTFDENTTATPTETNGSTVEFKNKEGKVVLKRTYATTGSVETSMEKHDTYYVYDVYSNLTYVIPPMADMALTQAILDDLCFQYQYDARNRLVAKKLPGKQWEYMVYDKLDRVVATGPAFSPFSDVTASGWLITKYDIFDQVVYTGWLNSSVTAATRKTMQDAQNTATTINESKQSSGTIDGIAVNYSNVVTPTGLKLLSVNYYDDYTIPSISTVTSVEGQTVATATKGLATGSWTRIATTTAETKGETSYILYDAKYHPIRSYTTNYLGGYTCTDSKLDAFSGQLQYTVQKHKRTTADTELTIKDAFTYSAQDRLLTHTHQINGGTVQLLADNTYDELGKLISKKVGNTSASPLQKVDYTYNIRGWMKTINNPTALQQGTDPADLFGFKMNYNTLDGNTAVANKLYNGNIAETFWSTATDGGFVRNYGYKYDNLNRLKDATYQKSNLVTRMYDENLTYDKNGNIMTLKRNGDNDAQTGTFAIDNLGYAYATNSNKLMSVTDTPASATSGFKDGNTTGDDYVYDANGNMTVDKNKKITSIVYNHLNLPTKIVFPTGNIVYIYNAAGQKVQKEVTENSTVTTTDYLEGYQYKNTVLQYFPTAEGYVKNTPVGSTNAYSYVFNYTDHLGNTRLSYTKDATTGSLKILEESNYYPFGLKHSPYNAVTPAQDYKYRYNSKEYQDELSLNLYDYGARNYDPAIGRWMNVDPLAETSRRFSPYVYALNNPVLFIDPDGMEAYKSQVDRSFEMSNSEWNSNRRADMDRQAGGDGVDVANPNGYVKPKYTVTASDADNDGEVDENGNPTDPPKKKGKSKSSGIENQTKMNLEIGDFFLSIAKFIADLQTWEVGGQLFEGASIVRNEAARGGTTGFRYMTEGELKVIQQKGLLRGGRAGETFFTKDLYKSATSAQNRLALPSAPTIRVEFQILNNPTLLRNGTKVLPANGMMGKGAEFMTVDPVRVRLINWQPLR